MRRINPLAFGAATAAALAVAIAAASLPGSPVRVGEVERGDGTSIVFVAALASAFVLYAAGLLLLRHHSSRVLAVCAIATAIQLIPLAGPLLLSHDVYSYWAYARIAAQHNEDPYIVPPASFPADPATRAVAPGWRGTTSVYGPGFTVSSVVADEAARGSAERVALIFRITAALAAIGATVLAAGIARAKSFAAAFVGWNPLLAVSFAGGGHNDALMLVLMLGALALALRKRDVGAGALWVLAGAVKAPALLLVPLQLACGRRRLWLGVGLTAVAGSIAASALFGSAWLTGLGRIGRHEARYAIPVRLEQFGVPDALAHLLALMVLVLGALWLLRQARNGRPRLALGACLLVLTTPWLLPWYATWPIALAAVEEDAAAQILAVAVAAYLLPARVPF